MTGLEDAIPNDALTLVFQGPVGPHTRENIQRTRSALPGAKIILSTLAPPRERLDVDEIVLSDDPGPHPPYKNHYAAPLNNINRQITSSQRGLDKVVTRYAAKVRTDCALTSSAFARLYECANGASNSRIVASSFFTLHPAGFEAFSFHVSDWFLFGETAALRTYLAARHFTREQARWFETRAHSADASFFAERYRAVFAPEQYLSVAFGKAKGYETPESIDDSRPSVIAAFHRFLANEFVIAEPDLIGLHNVRQAKLARSGFHRLNCVGLNDWLAICNEQAASTGALQSRFDRCKHDLDQARRRRARRLFSNTRYWAKQLLIPSLQKTRLIPLAAKIICG